MKRGKVWSNVDDTKFERFVRGEISENQYLGKKEDGVFHEGDRVRVTRKIGRSYDHEGVIGTVRIMTEIDSDSIGVEFDNDINGHDLQQRNSKGKYIICTYGHGWFCTRDMLEHVEE